MVTTTTTSTDSRYRTTPGEGYDGVVRLSIGGYSATGTLLFDGMAVLTVAHLFEGRTGSASVTFQTLQGSQTQSTVKTTLHPEHDKVQGNNDLAIVWLAQSATYSADRYNLYRNTNEVGQAFTLVGYGKTGTGTTGAGNDNLINPLRLKASNQFDADASELKSTLGSLVAWSPVANTQLLADFDDGTFNRDALGRLMNKTDYGRGLDEGFVAPGDSGGPAFISGLLAGTATYTTSLSNGNVAPDIDRTNNSSFGEIAAWQRISNYQQWIDQTLRANYPNAPTQPSEVKKEVTEGHSGTSYTYFLVKFNGMRSTPAQKLSVEYATRNGTATAGSDYITVRGILNLYETENYAVIPVEIIADTTPEPTENFYLDVFNPVGGNFGGDTIKLIAVRTILDDDGWAG